MRVQSIYDTILKLYYYNLEYLGFCKDSRCSVHFMIYNVFFTK